MSETPRPIYTKYSTEELMELVDIFNVSEAGQRQIRGILDAESMVPDAGAFFRYYNERSKVPEFEEKFAEKIGVKHALGVNSGTSALIAALVAAGVGPGDEVIVPGYTFFASVSAIVVAKGIPVIVEINETLTLDPDDFESKITDRTKAVIVVHMVGHPAEMDRINEIAAKHDVKVIEDVAQACGGSYKGKMLGAWGTLGCFSLDAYKIIGAGEGGVVTTNDEWLHTRAQSYHDTAACWRPKRFEKERQAGELFCGENYRMSETSAAVALAQLRKLDWIIDSSRAAYKQLKDEIALPGCAKWLEPADSDGVCGTNLGIMFDSKENAEKAILSGAGIGGIAASETKGARNWHLYWYWEHVLEQKTVTPEGCPFLCPHVKKLPDYSPDMCPKTKDVMTRLGLISINPTDTPEFNADRAKAISEKLAETFA